MKQNKPVKLTKAQQLQMLEASKQQRNLADLQGMVQKLMISLDELAYRIENTKNKKKRAELEKKFDRKLNLVMSLQQGNFSIQTH